MRKRSVLGKGAESIFEVTKKVEIESNRSESSISENIPSVTPVTRDVTSSTQSTIIGPKFKTFEVKLSILLREDQLDHLKKLERMIMKSRSSQNKKERITKNTIIRTYLDTLSGLDIDVREVKNEQDLLERIKSKIYYR